MAHLLLQDYHYYYCYWAFHDTSFRNFIIWYFFIFSSSTKLTSLLLTYPLLTFDSIIEKDDTQPALRQQPTRKTHQIWWVWNNVCGIKRDKRQEEKCAHDVFVRAHAYAHYLDRQSLSAGQIKSSSAAIQILRWTSSEAWWKAAMNHQPLLWLSRQMGALILYMQDVRIMVDMIVLCFWVTNLCNNVASILITNLLCITYRSWIMVSIR